jgi:hypothetical protein
MADRKQTPDVLAEILGEIPQPDTTGDVAVAHHAPPEPRLLPRVPAQEHVRRQAPAPRTVRWEHMLVSFQNYHGRRPRFVNGAEFDSWPDGPLIHDYLAQLGAEGWEVAGASAGSAMYGASDYHQVYFKRRSA